MTEVFLLMWLADVVGALGVVSVVLLVIVLLIVLFGLAFSLAEGKLGEFSVIVKKGMWVIPVIVIGLLLPSSKTVHVLAVASAGKAAASTEIGAKGLEAINAVLDKVIEKSKQK